MRVLLLPLMLLSLLALPVGTQAHPRHKPSKHQAEVDYSTRPEVRAFISEMMQKHGFPAADLYALFRHARHEPKVIKAIQPPSHPGVRSWATYRSRFVEPIRIRAGLAFWDRYDGVIQRAEQEYKVPAEVIASIIGVETIYGRNTGNFEVFSALTTLAFDYPPRAELFRGELEALLLLARDEKRSPLEYKGSYAGALGLPQFLPSSWRQWAVDFDGDGHVDLNKPEDAIGSVANFLAAHGWSAGGPILDPVTVEGESVAPLLAEGIRPKRLPAELTAFGVRVPVDAPAQPAALIDYVTPDGQTEYRIGYQNFFVITRYNRSTFYATVVSDLARSLKENREARELAAASRTQ